MNDGFDVIAAFADGELVNGDELDAALADAGGRAYLIDVLALRGLVSEGRVAPASIPGRQVPRSSGGLGLSQVGSKARLLVAVAALVIAGVAGGYFAGRAATASTMSSGAETSAAAVAPAAAPVPTHVIRIENGVNWNERAGGN